jgi:hypothetical protein
MMTNLLSTQKDAEFHKIPNLSWLPWVGSDILQNDRRLLIIGESHYVQGETLDEFKEDLKRHSDQNFTQKLILETQIQDKYKYRLLDNFWKALFKESPNKSILWQNIAFYNFIQRSMDYSSFDGKKTEKPNAKDFRSAWETFGDVVKILKPTDCIFLGLRAAEGFGNLKLRPDVSDFSYNYPDKIGHLSPVEGSFTIDGQKVNVSFIQHCSSHFSPSAWQEFLHQRHGELLKSFVKKGI